MTNKILKQTDYKKPEYLSDKLDLIFEIKSLNEVLVKTTMNIFRDCDNGVLELDLEKAEILEVLVDGEKVEYSHKDGKLSVPCNKESFVVQTTTVINPNKNKTGKGLYVSNGFLVTQCEPLGFRMIAPFIDRPDNMASFKVTIIADDKVFPILLSNGDTVEEKFLEDGRKSITFVDPFKKPSYLFALVAGDFEYIEDKFVTMSGREVALTIFVEEGNKYKVAHAMESLKKSMKWDEEVFGLEYDLNEFKIVAVNDFNSGAMENKGLNIFNASCVFADPAAATDGDFRQVEAVVAHEYFHNWTGDRVTLRDWFQLTLKEGLTVFRDQEFSSDMGSRVTCRIGDVRGLRSSQFMEDAGAKSHPIRPQEAQTIENFYTSTVYEKGAEVIRMMHTFLGEDGFRKGMDLYFERHDGQSVTCEDFVAAMADSSGMDLNQFFDSWYNQNGTPTINVEVKYEDAADVVELKVEQILLQGQKPFYFPLHVGLINENGEDVVDEILHVKEMKQNFIFEGITSFKVASLLRNFSAPVKLVVNYTDEDLKFLMEHDSDLFNRYDAAQRLDKMTFVDIVKQYQSGTEMTLPDDFFDVFPSIFLDRERDPEFTANQLSFLGISELVAEMDVYDYEAAHEVREFVIKKVAEKYEGKFVEIYEQYKDQPYSKDGESIGKRMLKNLALRFLFTLRGKYVDLVKAQLENATNMTDEIFAFSLLCDESWDVKGQYVSAFYDKWKHDHLVFNKWMRTQMWAHVDGLLQRADEIAKLPEFDKENPNNLYSLYAFGIAGNSVKFHSDNGESYEYIADKIIDIDKYNPAVAARTVSAFSTMKKFSEERQKLMRKQLEKIRDAGCSKNVMDIVDRILI